MPIKNALAFWMRMLIKQKNSIYNGICLVCILICAQDSDTSIEENDHLEVEVKESRAEEPKQVISEQSQAKNYVNFYMC